MFKPLIFCLGSFEREVLKHFDSIVERSLPLTKVISYYKQCPGAGKQVILDYVTFFEERKKVSYLKAPGISFFGVISKGSHCILSLKLF